MCHRFSSASFNPIQSQTYDRSLCYEHSLCADWTAVWPKPQLDFPANSQYSVYNSFAVVISLYFTRTMIEGCGGPTGYTAQRYMSVSTDREAGLMTLLWIFLLSFR